MTGDRRQRLLRQLARLREIEHRAAAIAAAEALAAAQRHERVAQRVQSLADDSCDAAGIGFAHELAGFLHTGLRVREMARTTCRQAGAAREMAEARLTEQRRARRKLDRLEDHRRLAAKDAATRAQSEKSAGGPPTTGKLARILNSKPTNNRETPCT